MGSCEEPVPPPNLHDQDHTHTTELGLTCSEPDPAAELLVQQLGNVALKDMEEEEEEVEEEGEEGGTPPYPLRPYAPDCQFYIRTGSCKFGLNCRFNHPLTRTPQVGKEREIEGEGLLEKIECKYYLRAGGCKYGSSCRFSHSKETDELAAVEYNFLGLPMRNGEKECPYYMRTGSCGYGATCCFHHPDPTSSGGSEPNGNGQSVRGFNSFGNHNSESTVLKLSGASQPSMASWSSHMLSNKRVPYSDNRPSYVPAMPSLPQQMHSNLERNGHQVPIYSQGLPRILNSGLTLTTLVNKSDASQGYEQTRVEEFPERPGRPECDYFMKTGDCKYKAACRYNHPKIRAPGLPACTLSDKGLPLRPGKKVCWHYESYGICKYGRACLFDHPPNHSPSPFPVGSEPEPPLDHNSATAGGNRMAGCEVDEIQASGWD